MGRDVAQIVVEERPLHQIRRFRIGVEIVEEALQRAGHHEDVAVHAQDEFAGRLLENEIPDRRAADVSCSARNGNWAWRLRAS